MTGKTHIALGTAVAVTLFPPAGITATVSLIGGAVVGSLIPDIDHPKAMINQKILPFKNKLFKILLFTSIGLFMLTGGLGPPNDLLKILSIFIIVAGLSSHREFTHSIAGIGVELYICYLITQYYDMYYLSLGLGIGAVIHIIADLFTSNGVALFYPLSKRRIKMPLTLRTNSMVDNIIFIFSTCLLAITLI
ncbi:metal-dependent hydrolase [Alkaliphilus pronyensis]|uniref:Metal-dependent hydrolase n=1 Tax=Alkaliphilus pronyensis TaxID=1482732 RepID=A0A6I0F129_9FIRM|nr:metal-dependent hydrolase [Alkaliphilus pronyensis]KAB3535627.1 metal-dependent hydrolase [Alkaliphilus pronyensis]